MENPWLDGELTSSATWTNLICIFVIPNIPGLVARLLKFTVPRLRQKWLELCGELPDRFRTDLFISGVVHIASEHTMNAGSTFHIFLHTHCLFCLERASRSKNISGGWCMFLNTYHFLPQKSLYQLFWDIEVPRSDVLQVTSPWPVLHVLLPLVLGIVPPNVSEGEIPTWQLPKKVPIHLNVFLVTSQFSFIQKKKLIRLPSGHW